MTSIGVNFRFNSTHAIIIESPARIQINTIDLTIWKIHHPT